MLDANVAYSSNWEIDQITRFTTTVAFTANNGNTLLHNIPTENQISGSRILFDAMWRVPGGRWQQFGRDYFIFSTPTQLYIYNPNAAISMQVRYMTYSDKLEH